MLVVIRIIHRYMFVIFIGFLVLFFTTCVLINKIFNAASYIVCFTMYCHSHGQKLSYNQYQNYWHPLWKWPKTWMAVCVGEYMANERTKKQKVRLYLILLLIFTHTPCLLLLPALVPTCLDRKFTSHIQQADSLAQMKAWSFITVHCFSALLLWLHYVVMIFHLHRMNRIFIT